MTMKQNTMISTLILAFSLFGSGTSTAADAVVAKMGDREVKASEIAPYLRDLSPPERAALSTDKAELERFVRLVLLREALLQEASSAGWDKKPEVQAGLERVRGQYLVDSYLGEVAKVPDDYPSDAEIEQVYEAEKENLKVPQRYELSQIFIASGQDKNAARKRAGELHATLQAEPGEFSSLAQRNSDDAASAGRGGKLGWLAADNITPEIRGVLGSLKKGQISKPVEGREGFHIVKVDDTRPAGTASLDEVRGELAALLRQRRAALNRDEHLAGLLQRQPVSINELALDELKKTSDD